MEFSPNISPQTVRSQGENITSPIKPSMARSSLLAQHLQQEGEMAKAEDVRKIGTEKKIHILIFLYPLEESEKSMCSYWFTASPVQFGGKL